METIKAESDIYMLPSPAPKATMQRHALVIVVLLLLKLQPSSGEKVHHPFSS
jgi:hypothetical protein